MYYKDRAFIIFVLIIFSAFGVGACGKTTLLFEGRATGTTEESSDTTSDSDSDSTPTPPKIQGISPSLGSIDGGTQLMLVGTGFTPGPNTIWLGGSLCTEVNYISSSVLTCVTGPNSSGAKSVLLANSIGQLSYYPALSQSYANGYTFSAPPPILIGNTGVCHNASDDPSVCPASGWSGESTQVKISGNSFQSGAIVLIGGQICCNISLNVGETCEGNDIYPTVNTSILPQTISCYAPPNPIIGGAIVSVINPDQQSIVTSDTPYTYVDPAYLTYPSPSSTPTVNVAMTSMSIDSTKFKTLRTVKFYIDPELPSGISLNESTGTISGTPDTVTAETTYTISAVNDKGRATSTTITIEVKP